MQEKRDEWENELLSIKGFTGFENKNVCIPSLCKLRKGLRPANPGQVYKSEIENPRDLQTRWKACKGLQDTLRTSPSNRAPKHPEGVVPRSPEGSRSGEGLLLLWSLWPLSNRARSHHSSEGTEEAEHRNSITCKSQPWGKPPRRLRRNLENRLRGQSSLSYLKSSLIQLELLDFLN
jgi:hypothetical protein